MTLALNILLSIISIGILLGRMYEILVITDTKTGFLVTNGVVFNPVILSIYVIIVICCGLLIFSENKSKDAFFAKSDGFCAVISGICFGVWSVVNMQTFSMMNIFALCGSIGLVLLGVFGLKNNVLDKVVMCFVVIFSFGLCLKITVYEATTVYSMDFLKDALSYVAFIIFFLLVFKNAYSPGKNSKIALFIAGYISFSFCAMTYMSELLVDLINNALNINSALWNISFVFIGFYAFLTSLSVSQCKNHAICEKNDIIETNVKSCLNHNVGSQLTWKNMKEEKGVLDNFSELQSFFKGDADFCNQDNLRDENLSTKIKDDVNNPGNNTKLEANTFITRDEKSDIVKNLNKLQNKNQEKSIFVYKSQEIKVYKPVREKDKSKKKIVYKRDS